MNRLDGKLIWPEVEKTHHFGWSMIEIRPILSFAASPGQNVFNVQSPKAGSCELLASLSWLKVANFR